MKYAWYCSEDHGDAKTSYYHGGWRKNRKSFDNAFRQAEQALKRKYKKRNAQGNLGHIPIDEIYWKASAPMMPHDEESRIEVSEIEAKVNKEGTCLLRPAVEGMDYIQGWIQVETMQHLEEDQQWLIDSMKADAQEYANQDGKSVTITNAGGLGSVTAQPNKPKELKHRKLK